MAGIRDKALLDGDNPNFFKETEGKSSRDVDRAELVTPSPFHVSEIVESP